MKKMNFRQKLAIGAFVAGGFVAQSAAPTRWHAISPAYAQRAAATYDPDSSPFVAGPGIRAIAAQAKAASQLATAKKLHSMLQVGAGTLKVAEAGITIRDDRPPRTAEEALKKGGDCSEFAYVVLSAAKELGLSARTITLDLGDDILHILPVVEIDGKAYILDPQTEEFGKGTVEIGSQRITFTYESLGRGKGPKLLWESTSEQSLGAWHAEWCNYLKQSKKDEARLRQAATACKKAIALNPDDTHSPRKLDDASAPLVNMLMRKAEGMFERQPQRAAELFEEAIDNAPSTMSKAHKAQLHENAASGRYNSGDFAKAAEHYDAAYGLTGNKEYKKSAEDARSKGK
jgi:hypothetical protein